MRPWIKFGRLDESGLITRGSVSRRLARFEGEFAKKVYASKKFLSPFGLMSDFNFSRRTVGCCWISHRYISSNNLDEQKKEIGLKSPFTGGLKTDQICTADPE